MAFKQAGSNNLLFSLPPSLLSYFVTVLEELMAVANLGAGRDDYMVRWPFS